MGLVTLGSLASTWITSLITKKGVGSGEAVVLVAGSSLGFVRQLLAAIHGTTSVAAAIQRLAFAGILGLVMAVFSIYQVKAVRRVPVQFARIRNSPSLSYLPLLLNRGGILPVSSAVGFLAVAQFPGLSSRPVPATTCGLESRIERNHGTGQRLALGRARRPDRPVHLCLQFLDALAAAFKGGPVADRANETQRNLYPGIRPGGQTEAYLAGIMVRITLPGGLGLALLAAGLPYAILRLTQQNVLVTVLSVFVFVQTLDRLRDEIQAHGLAGKYDGLLGARKRRPRVPGSGQT